jgi:uncharacterized metal-binding protein
MPELPQQKVGIIACSGEELPEGTITRLAALKVLQELRPEDTATICLPLFLAGGEGDRAFARYYPTIAVDGCEKRCAYRGTERYSNQPAAGFVVTDLISKQHLDQPQGLRKLNPAGMRAVDLIAEKVADHVDVLLGKAWSRREGKFAEEEVKQEAVATCSCGSGIPIQNVVVSGQEKTLMALPLIFKSFYQNGKAPENEPWHELMEMVRIYNQIDPIEEAAVEVTVKDAYTFYWRQQAEKP